MEGHGVYTFADGSKYEGPYKDDKQHGIGFWYKNGLITKREYCEDVLVREVDPLEEQKVGA